MNDENKRRITPNDCGDLVSVRLPLGHLHLVHAMRQIAKREQKTIGRVYIEAMAARVDRDRMLAETPESDEDAPTVYRLA